MKPYLEKYVKGILEEIKNHPDKLYTSREINKIFHLNSTETNAVMKFLRDNNSLYYQIIHNTFYYWAKK